MMRNLLVSIAGMCAAVCVAEQVVKEDATARFDLNKPFAELAVDTALEPGRPVAEWKAQAAEARASGERLPDRLTVAVATLTYADGSSFDVNLRYGESVGAGVRDWWNPEDGFIYHMAFADVVSARVQEEGGLTYDVIYKTRILNPQPDKAVSSLEINAAPGLGEGTLMLFGQPDTTGRSDTTYFVSPTGADANPGSFEKPWKTLGKAAATIKSGDTVYVRGGLYTPEKRIVFRGLKARKEQPTRIIGWQGETATFDFMGCHWDMSPDREKLGFEHFPHDVSVLHLYECDGALVKNLHLLHSRSRGLGAEECRNVELSYNFIFRTHGPGIRFANIHDGRLIGNCVIRPVSIGMGPGALENAGSGPVAFQKGLTEKYMKANDPYYMPDLASNVSAGEWSRKPPMEGVDCGKLWNVEMGYNEIAWGDKEHLLVDGDVDGLRIHHFYVHDAYNRPWAAGIAPNGYGEQQNIEIDHNIVMRAAGPLGVGTEGGGFGKKMKFHHNITAYNAWNSVAVTGAWGDKDADLTHIAIYNNTSYHDGHLASNKGPAGAFPISFSSGKGKVGRTVKGVVEDVTIENNLAVQPRDYVVALVNPRDLKACRIEIKGNVSDLKQPSDVFKDQKNAKWQPVHDEGVTVIADKPLLRDPEAYDFRSTAAAGSAGAFGPGARWVEL